MIINIAAIEANFIWSYSIVLGMKMTLYTAKFTRKEAKKIVKNNRKIPKRRMWNQLWQEVAESKGDRSPIELLFPVNKYNFISLFFIF